MFLLFYISVGVPEPETDRQPLEDDQKVPDDIPEYAASAVVPLDALDRVGYAKHNVVLVIVLQLQ